MSTRETQKAGVEAVAMTVMRYLASGADTSRDCFCHGWPVGTKTTSSRSKNDCTSLAATRCPWWIGSKVPPMTPTRRRPPAAGVLPSLTRRRHRSRSGVVAAAAEGQQAPEQDQQQHEHATTDEPRVDPPGCSGGEGDERRDRHGPHSTVL